MRLFTIVFLAAALTGPALADSKTETVLRTKIAAQDQQIAALTKQLAERVTIANKIKTLDGSVGEKLAVATAQAESSQTLANTDSSISRQIEFEKQLSALQIDLHKAVDLQIGSASLQKSYMYLLVIQTILFLACLGFIVFHRGIVEQSLDGK